jgi:hypothetical protein
MAQAFHTMAEVLTKDDATNGPSRGKIVPRPREEIPGRAIPRSSSVTVVSIRRIYTAARGAGFTTREAVSWTSPGTARLQKMKQ